MKFIGRWLSTDGVVHVDNPYKRSGVIMNRFNALAIPDPLLRAKELERTLERHPCGRASAAIHKYLPRNAVITCLTCLVAVLREHPTASSTPSTSSRRNKRRAGRGASGGSTGRTTPATSTARPSSRKRRA